MNRQKVRGIAFDFGGVININDGGNILRLLADKLNLPFDEFRQVYFQHNHLANVNNVHWEDMAVQVVKTFDDSNEAEAAAREVIQEHNSKDVINTQLLELFPLLRKAGYKLAILSNAGTHLRAFLEKEGIAPLVDEIIISGEVGHQKPHKEAFQVLFDRLKLPPAEVVFIDDSKKSLEKADEIGYVPILFSDNKKLLEDLKSLGVEF